MHLYRTKGLRQIERSVETKESNDCRLGKPEVTWNFRVTIMH